MTEVPDGLPANWATTTIGEICPVLQYGYTASASQRECGPRFLRITDIQNGNVDWPSVPYCPIDADKVARYQLQDGDIVFARTGGTVGKSFIIRAVPGRAVFASYLIRISAHSEIHPSFLYYFFQSASYWEQIGLKKGGLQGNVNATTLSSLTLSICPFNEQRRIVDEIEKQLTRLDAAVAALERARANLKRYRAAVLKAACEGRLVPTEAELARAEDRGYETGEQLLTRILAERRARWEADQLAKMRAKGKEPRDDRWKAKYKEPDSSATNSDLVLPEGWTQARWEQVGLSQNGRAFPSKEYQPEGIRLLRPGNLHESGRVVWTEKNTRCMPNSWAETAPDLLVGPGELVMNLTAQSLRDEFLGRTCITGPDEHCLLNQRLARLTPVEMDAQFVLFLLKSRLFRQFVDGLNTGSLIQHMFTGQLDRFVLPLPPLAEQRRIALALAAPLSVIEDLERTVDTNMRRSERLRQSILKHAFEGKLVPQGPNDEPASALLERIRADRNGNAPRGRKRRTASR